MDDQVYPANYLALMPKMDVREAKAQLSKLLDRAHRGEEIILEPLPPRHGGWLAGNLGKKFWEPLPDEELEAWGE